MQTALITGASSGIGAEFAKQLAALKTNLILVARSELKLQELATQLRDRFQVEVEVIVQDLSVSESAGKVFEATQAKNLAVDLLINNAGFGDYGAFAQSDRAKQLAMIQLNIATLVDLTYLFLPQMQNRRSGSIINVASIGAFQPLPYLSVYAATKAFVLSFTEAITAENRSYGLKIQALCPGATETEFFKVSGMDAMGGGKSPSMAGVTDVVQDSLKALASDRSVVVTGGWSNNLMVNVPRFLPRRAIANSVEKLFRPK